MNTNRNVKTVVAYGDSNTWGWNPATGDRHPAHIRWTGVLQDRLGAPWEVIEEGLSGRTTVWDDPIEEYKNGKQQIVPILLSHKPIDIVVIMLGTNDLKHRYALCAADVAESLATLVHTAASAQVGPDDGQPRFLLMAPVRVAGLTEWAEQFAGAEQKSLLLAAQIKAVAARLGVAFADADSVARPSPLDGVHLDAQAHRAIGELVASTIIDW